MRLSPGPDGARSQADELDSVMPHALVATEISKVGAMCGYVSPGRETYSTVSCWLLQLEGRHVGGLVDDLFTCDCTTILASFQPPTRIVGTKHQAANGIVSIHDL